MQLIVFDFSLHYQSSIFQIEHCLFEDFHFDLHQWVLVFEIEMCKRFFFHSVKTVAENLVGLNHWLIELERNH